MLHKNSVRSSFVFEFSLRIHSLATNDFHFYIHCLERARLHAYQELHSNRFEMTKKITKKKKRNHRTGSMLAIDQSTKNKEEKRIKKMERGVKTYLWFYVVAVLLLERILC